MVTADCPDAEELAPYIAAIDRVTQGIADEADLPVEFFRTAQTSGDWLRARAEAIETFTQPHHDRAATIVGAMQDAVAQAMALDEAGKLGWQTPEDAPLLPRRCASEACDEYDGIHCYADGCAMASRRA